MNRLAALVLLAAGSTAIAAEPPLLPTVPQIPPPVVHQEGGTVVQAGGWGDPVPPSSDAHPTAAPAAAPCDTAPVGPVARHGHGPATSICPGSPIKQWLCFRPTTAHALPYLRSAPYVGPITGQFPCTPGAGPGCASGAGCGTDGARGHGGLRPLGRGCRDGTCVTPAEESFGGYKFASPVSTRPGAPAMATGSVPPSTSYRPAVPPTGMSAPAASTRTPTVLESLKRSFGRP